MNKIELVVPPIYCAIPGVGNFFWIRAKFRSWLKRWATWLYMY